jgi:hypothetical protein
MIKPSIIQNKVDSQLAEMSYRAVNCTRQVMECRQAEQEKHYVHPGTGRERERERERVIE